MRRLTASLFATALFLVPPGLKAQDAIPAKSITVPGSTVADPTVSPDGRWVVFAKLVSNSDARLMIQPLAGGAARELQIGRGQHRAFMFTPQGDRIVFLSTIPRQSATENQWYLMSAPFDTKTGTLMARERQVALEPARVEPRMAASISPDGKSLAYVSCCDGSALRVVPIVGGNARTLVSVKESEGGLVPGWIGWSSDSKFVTYHKRVGDQSTYQKVSVNGGEPVVVSQFTGGAGMITRDGRYFVSPFPIKIGPSSSGVQMRSVEGPELQSVIVPMRLDLSFSVDGKYLVGRTEGTIASIKVATVSGGASKQIGDVNADEWPEGWAADSRSLQFTSVSNGKKFVVIKDLEGRDVGRVEETPDMVQEIGVQGDWFVWSEGIAQQGTGVRIMAKNLKTGVQRQLAGDGVFTLACCGATGPGGSYVGINGGEFFVTKVRGDRMQIHGMEVTGESRLVADVSKALLGQTGFSIFKNRAVYREFVADSIRLQMTTAPGKAPITLSTVPRGVQVRDIAWSYDGRKLSWIRRDKPQSLFVLHFDDNGAVQGAPREYTLPFENFYETFWLPDGSGMTMIAQSINGGNAEVALVKLADPSNPVFLSKTDVGNKWSHSQSPDGKHVAYPVEKVSGDLIYIVEVAELLKRAGASR